MTPERIRRRNTMLAVLGTLLGLASVLAMIAVMLYVGRPAPPPEPEEDAARRTLAQLQAADERRLTTYGWIDFEQGVVRIPIDAAMEKLIEESRE